MSQTIKQSDFDNELYLVTEDEDGNSTCQPLGPPSEDLFDRVPEELHTLLQFYINEWEERLADGDVYRATVELTYPYGDLRRM